jgi:hypothetical protein
MNNVEQASDYMHASRRRIAEVHEQREPRRAMRDDPDPILFRPELEVQVDPPLRADIERLALQPDTEQRLPRHA